MKIPTQYLYSMKFSRDYRNLPFSLTFQVSGLHSSVRTKKTLPFVRAGQLIYVFFFVWSLLGCCTRLLIQSRNRCSALNAQRSLCQKLLTLNRRTRTLQPCFFTSCSVSKRHAQKTRARRRSTGFFLCLSEIVSVALRIIPLVAFKSPDASHSFVMFRSIVETIIGNNQ